MKILFCGVGALGSHVIYLTHGLEADRSAIDFDRVETKNLASQWFVKAMVGKNKATAVKLQMQNFFGVRVHDLTNRLTETNVETLLSDMDLVVDGFDNAASRRLVQDMVRKESIPCVHGGLAADGAFGVVRWDEAFVIDEEDVPGQATCDGGQFLPMINMVASALAESIQQFKGKQLRLNWNVSPKGAECFR